MRPIHSILSSTALAIGRSAPDPDDLDDWDEADAPIAAADAALSAAPVRRP